MSTLETRLQHLEQIEAIRRLKHFHYCWAVDAMIAGDSTAFARVEPHLADDVVADFTGRPLMEGKATVGEFLSVKVPAALSWAQHRVTNEVIDIDGDNATALWYLDCPALFRAGNERGVEGSALITGRYEEVYVRERGVWKWQRITALLDVVQPFEVNWRQAQLRERNR